MPMNIIKQFDDQDFSDRYYAYTNDDLSHYRWSWGLGDDGKLYCNGGSVNIRTGWSTISSYYNAAETMSFKDMKRIIKEFDHLLVWL